MILKEKQGKYKEKQRKNGVRRKAKKEVEEGIYSQM